MLRFSFEERNCAQIVLNSSSLHPTQAHSSESSDFWQCLNGPAEEPVRTYFWQECSRTRFIVSSKRCKPRENPPRTGFPNSVSNTLLEDYDSPLRILVRGKCFFHWVKILAPRLPLPVDFQTNLPYSQSVRKQMLQANPSTTLNHFESSVASLLIHAGDHS